MFGVAVNGVAEVDLKLMLHHGITLLNGTTLSMHTCSGFEFSEMLLFVAVGKRGRIGRKMRLVHFNYSMAQ